MTFRKLISVCAVVICTSVSLPAHADTGRWLKAESDHFVIYSSTSAKTASLYLNRLEQYRYILSRFHGLTAQDDADAPKTRVYFVDSFADLKQTAPHMRDYVGGYYKSCAEDQAAVAINRKASVNEVRQLTIPPQTAGTPSAK